MNALPRDLRYAMRQLGKSRGTSLMAALTLALGIGANTAIFLLTYSILLKSLPVPDPGQLVSYTLSANRASEIQLTYPLYRAMREHQIATSSLFAAFSSPVTLKEEGGTSEIPIEMVTGSIFSVLEIRPYIGRVFDERSGERDQPFVPEAVLGYDFWRTHFNADPAILGHALNLGGTDLSIVGVLPPGFEGMNTGVQCDAYVPLTFERILEPKFVRIDQAGASWLTVIGRLKAGQTLTTAAASLAGSQSFLFNEADPTHRAFGANVSGGGFRMVVSPARTGVSGLHREYQKPLLALECLCALMMLLCAANTGLLILSRVSGRAYEFALRIALGAPRRRLIVYVLGETAILALAGLAGGNLLGWQLAHMLLAIIDTAAAPIALDLGIGVPVILFALCLTIGSALLAGFWPAWRASRAAPALGLRQIHGQRKAAGLGRWIIPSQVALGLVLIYAALLLSGTLRAYLRQHLGFMTDGVTLAELNYRINEADDPVQIRKGFQLVDRLEAMPGIEAATIVSSPPMRWFDTEHYFARDALGALHHSNAVSEEIVSPSYFNVMGTAILEGRSFTGADINGDKVCVISHSAAHFFFPGEIPLGRILTAGDAQPPELPSKDASSNIPDTCRVIGVADDARLQNVFIPTPMAVYKLAGQQTNPFELHGIAVRSRNPALAAAAIRRAAAEVMPGALPKIYTLDRAIGDDLNRQRLLSSVSGGFALLALALVGTGLYGILSRAVTEARREIGIRMALGAQRRQIVCALAWAASLRIAFGIAAGAVLAWFAARLLQSLLFGVKAESPSMAAATLAVLLGVLALAFLLPAWRATTIDPMEAIREE